MCVRCLERRKREDNLKVREGNEERRGERVSVKAYKA
jgi:hypothetical protein